MWRKCFLCLAVLIVANGTSSASQFGPPSHVAADMDIPVSVGLGYYRYKGRFKPDDSDGWNRMNIRMEALYLQTNYSFTDEWEGYWRVGGADMKARGGPVNYDNWRDSTRIFTSVGLNGLLYEMPQQHLFRLGVGTFMQATLYSNYSDRQHKQRFQYRMPWNINLGPVVQLELVETYNTMFYASPFFYYAAANVKHRDALGQKDRTTYEEKGNIGGFTGMRVPLPADMFFTIETQYKSRLSTGISLMKAF